VKFYLKTDSSSTYPKPGRFNIQKDLMYRVSKVSFTSCIFWCLIGKWWYQINNIGQSKSFKPNIERVKIYTKCTHSSTLHHLIWKKPKYHNILQIRLFTLLGQVNSIWKKENLPIEVTFLLISFQPEAIYSKF
jgi:hypothetical protein